MPKARAKTTLTCPHCNYTCKNKLVLQRHAAKKHPNTSLVPLSLTTLQDLFGLLESAVSPKRAEAVSILADAMTAQETKLRVTLATVALDKAERIARLGPLMKRLDGAILKKLESGNLDEMEAKELMELSQMLSASVNSDSAFLERILSLRSPGSSDLFRQLIEDLRRAAQEADTFVAASRSGLQGRLAALDRLSPAERENLRLILKAIQDKPPEDIDVEVLSEGDGE